MGCPECDIIKTYGIDKKGNSFILSILGDVHGDVPQLLKHSKYNYNNIFIVGDVGIFTSEEEAKKDKESFKRGSAFICDMELAGKYSFNIPIRSILGNHDNFVNLSNPVYKKLNFNYVKNGTVLKIGNLTIATLGGIYSPKKISYKTSELIDYNKRFFTQEDIDSLIKKTKNKKIDILITHEAAAGILPKMKSGVDEGSRHLTKLLQELKPKYYIHGHHHKEYKSTFENITVIGLGNFRLNRKTFVNFNMLTGELIPN